MMKTKLMLRIGLWMIIPAVLSLLMNMAASFAYWTDYAKEDMANLNHPFAFFMGLAGWFSVLPIVYVSMLLMKYAHRIDSLEESEKEYEKATREMEDARDAFTELLKNKNNGGDN